MIRMRAPYEAVFPRARPALGSLAQKTAADSRPRGLRPTPGSVHVLLGDYLARCIGDTTTALDIGIIQERPRGDDGMAQTHRVYFLGNLTRNPEVRYEPNGMAVARCGVAVPTRLRQGTPGTPTSAVLMWLPLDSRPKGSAPRCTKAAAS